MFKEHLHSIQSILSTRVFDLRDTLLLPILFTAAIVFLRNLVHFLQDLFSFKALAYWPIGEVYPFSPTKTSFLVAAVVTIFFCVLVGNFERIQNRIWILIAGSFLLVLGTNLIAGPDLGLIVPISGGGENGFQYYHDAIKIQNALSFIAEFGRLQPTLHAHSLVHPPGPPITIFILVRLLGEPAFVSIAIAVISVSLSSIFFYSLLLTRVKPVTASYLTFLYMLIPAVQIYYLATIDALVASFLLGALYFFETENTYSRFIGTLVCLFLASYLTFAFIFVVPVLFMVELLTRKTIKTFTLVVLGVAILHGLIYILLGFNYFESYRFAASIERSKGFSVILDPLSFFLWVQDVLAIVVFFGPFLTLLFFRGLPITVHNYRELFVLTIIAILLLLGVLSQLGTFPGGESARFSLYIYPYLLLPIAAYLDNIQINSHERFQLFGVVFLQSLVMQLTATYFW